jgi:ligand-binding sensor domain-containing protein
MNARLVALGLALGISAPFGGFLEAQTDDIRFEKTFAEQGGMSSDILCMTQDKQGFIWFGSSDGLHRFDGYKTTTFKHIMSDTTSISDNRVDMIVEDSSADLWIIAGGGMGRVLNRFRHESGTFTHYKSGDFESRDLGEGMPTYVLRDSHDNIWICSDGGGLNMYDPARDRFLHYHDPSRNPLSPGSDSVSCIVEEKPGIFWVATRNGLERFDSQRDVFDSLGEELNRQLGLRTHLINLLSMDSGGDYGSAHGTMVSSGTTRGTGN